MPPGLSRRSFDSRVWQCPPPGERALGAVGAVAKYWVGSAWWPTRGGGAGLTQTRRLVRTGGCGGPLAASQRRTPPSPFAASTGAAEVRAHRHQRIPAVPGEVAAPPRRGPAALAVTAAGEGVAASARQTATPDGAASDGHSRSDGRRLRSGRATAHADERVRRCDVVPAGERRTDMLDRVPRLTCLGSLARRRRTAA